jgi:hypothetical protein
MMAPGAAATCGLRLRCNGAADITNRAQSDAPQRGLEQRIAMLTSHTYARGRLFVCFPLAAQLV